MAILATLTTVWLATLFAYSASMKLVDYAHARRAVEGYRILPVPMARRVGAALPWAELGAAGLLVAPATRSAGAVVCVVLGAVFALGSTSALVRRIDASCGCAGGGERINLVTAARAVVILAAGIAILGIGSAANGAVVAAATLVVLLPAAVAALRRREIRRERRQRAKLQQAEVGRLTALLAREAS